ncbi:MAG: alanyl-tRNA editing protein [Nanoarchaeota archaeon]|nr:alanyl-tRNA editing protein [Nanoarchaeota archaeon]
MSKALYMDDGYLKEFEATVESVKDDKYVVLDQTAFYPLSGGVAYDTGALTKDNEEFPVVYVGKFDNQISHEVSKPGLKQGDKVKGKIDWDKRYKLMRLHTAAHLVSGIFHNKTKALITGGSIDTERARTDFSLENFDRQMIDDTFKLANDLIQKDTPVKVYYMDCEEALKIPDMVKLANKMPPEVDKLRIVELEGIDRQPDGGPHVKSIKEIGTLEILKVENKGKNNRRVYYSIK